MQESQTNKMSLGDIIANTVAQAALNEEVQAHIEGFVRIDENGKNRGSFITGLTTLKSTFAFLRKAETVAVEWDHERMNREYPGSANHPARYFHINLKDLELHGVESLLTVSDLKEIGDLDSIRVQEGRHGFELAVTDAAKEKYKDKQRYTEEAWIIVGPHAKFEDNVMVQDFGVVVYTWYAGRMTAKMTQLDHCAVKI